MATISENLQILKDSTDAIKQAIIYKGGTIEGDITTWADAIQGIENSGVQEAIPTNIVYSETANADNAKIYDFLMNLSLDGIKMSNDRGGLSGLSVNNLGIHLNAHSGFPIIFDSNGICKIDASDM